VEFLKKPKDERRAQMKEGWNKCMKDKVGCIGGAVKQFVRLNSIGAKILLNGGKRMMNVIPDNKASRFISAAGTAVGKKLKAVGSAIINPINTGRAVVDLVKTEGKKVMNTTPREAIKGLKNRCKGQNSEGQDIDRATCLGNMFGKLRRLLWNAATRTTTSRALGKELWRALQLRLKGPL
jgi:hypothetical protein